MKRIVWLAGALLVVADLYGATVVLKGGKRLDVANYTVNGSYVTVEYTGGRRESYPLAAVDLQATRKAGGVRTEAPGAAKPEGPHSPFLGAKSSGGSGGLVVTDADVKHTETPGTGDEAKKEETKEESGDGTEDSQVVLVGYEKKKVGDKDWEITATVANVGKTSVQNVSATMRILDSKGKPLTVGSGTLTGKLDAGKQGNISGRVSLEADPVQVAFDLTWQRIVAGAKPSPSPAPAVGKPTPAPSHAAAPLPPGWSVPAGSSPNTLPSNLLAPVPPTTLGTAPQVAPERPRPQ